MRRNIKRGSKMNKLLLLPLLLVFFTGASGYQNTTAPINISIADRYVQVTQAIHIFIETSNTEPITMYGREPSEDWAEIGQATANTHFTISTSSTEEMDREYQARTSSVNSNILKVFWRNPDNIPNTDIQYELLKRYGANFGVLIISVIAPLLVFVTVGRFVQNPFPLAIVSFYLAFIISGIILEISV